VHLYPTLEIFPTAPAAEEFLSNNAIPIQFTAELLDKVINGGIQVTVVFYIPKNAPNSIERVEITSKTQVLLAVDKSAPGPAEPPEATPPNPKTSEVAIDPVQKVARMGIIVAILSVGAIDLELAGDPARAYGEEFCQFYFLDPDGMEIGWQHKNDAGEPFFTKADMKIPARRDLRLGGTYRMKLTNIPGRPGVVLYPSLKLVPSTPVTRDFCRCNAIPVEFTAEDFDQVIDGGIFGNFVTKVVYIPDQKHQELAISGVEMRFATRLEPGVDPILEAAGKGTVVGILSMGAIDPEATKARPSSGTPHQK
jgi:hypothetical protein